jgi:mono/diheme cytochrome c family protein
MNCSLLKSAAAVIVAAGFVAGNALVGARAATEPSSPSESSPAAVTFTKDVAPILYKNCVKCHRPGAIAPMSLVNFDAARPWAKAIKEQVSTRVMPPWFADPRYGKFANDASLSQKDIDTIVAWVNAGAPKGNDADLAPPPNLDEDGWTIGKPDVILTMKEEYLVPADGMVEYLYFEIPTNFTEDKWVQSLEIRPGNSSVVHHVIASAHDPGTGGAALRRVTGEVQLGGYTPNRTGIVFPPGVAKRIKAGSSIVLQMHYTPNGEAAKDRTSVGFVFAKSPVHKSLMTGAAMNTGFAIPPNDANYEVKSSSTMKEDVHLLSFMPHMHFRGKDFTYTAVYPDGRSEILLSVPKYDFGWQLTYAFEKPVALPKGTRLDCVAHFDNSRGNKANPDPSQQVRWGDQTWEEMMIGWFAYTRDSEQLSGTTAGPASPPRSHPR